MASRIAWWAAASTALRDSPRIAARTARSAAEASRQAKSGATARWRTWCADVTALLTRLHAAEEARVYLERQYLEGHPALFPDAIEDGARLRERAERLLGWATAWRR